MNSNRRIVRRWHWAGVLLPLCFLSAGSAQTTNPHVFHVRASGGDCMQQRSLTGFRVEGRRGIVTALHGVAGCTTISATLRHGTESEAYFDLQTTEVSIPLDIAVLTSREILDKPMHGLPVDAVAQLDHDVKVSLVGYPIESSQVELFQITLTRPPLTTIRERMNTGIPALMARGSPDVDVQLLSLEGSVYPGHSGAPVLFEGRVVGVALGGVGGGGALGWAARWIDVEDRLVVVTDQVASELSRLARNHPAEAAFAIKRNESLQVRMQTGESQFREALIDDASDLSNEYFLGHSDLDPVFVINVYVQHGDSLVAWGKLGATLETVDRRFAPLRFRVIKDGVFVLQVRVALPDVAGLTAELALEALERSGLSVGPVLDLQSSEVPAGAVVGTIPARGTEVDLGTRVDVMVSTGPATLPEPPHDDPVGRTDLERLALSLDALSRSVAKMHTGLGRTRFWFSHLRNVVVFERLPDVREEETCPGLAAVVSEIREPVILVRREQVGSRDLIAASERLLAEMRAGDAAIDGTPFAREQGDLLSQLNGRFSDMATDVAGSLRDSRTARAALLDRPHAPQCLERVSGDLLNLEEFLRLLGLDNESLAGRLQALHVSLREVGVERAGLIGDDRSQEVDAPLRLVVRGVPTDDSRVRDALLFAVTWDMLPAVVAEAAFGDSMTDLTGARPSYDPERSRELMYEAGHYGVPIELRLAEAATPAVVHAVRALATDWSAFGSTTSIVRGSGGTAAPSTITVDVLSHR